MPDTSLDVSSYDIQQCEEAEKQILTILNGLSEENALLVVQYVICACYLGVCPNIPLSEFLASFNQGVTSINARRSYDA